MKEIELKLTDEQIQQIKKGHPKDQKFLMIEKYLLEFWIYFSFKKEENQTLQWNKYMHDEFLTHACIPFIFENENDELEYKFITSLGFTLNANLILQDNLIRDMIEEKDMDGSIHSFNNYCEKNFSKKMYVILEECAQECSKEWYQIKQYIASAITSSLEVEE